MIMKASIKVLGLPLSKVSYIIILKTTKNGLTFYLEKFAHVKSRYMEPKKKTSRWKFGPKILNIKDQPSKHAQNKSNSFIKPIITKQSKR